MRTMRPPHRTNKRRTTSPIPRLIDNVVRFFSSQQPTTRQGTGATASRKPLSPGVRRAGAYHQPSRPLNRVRRDKKNPLSFLSPWFSIIKQVGLREHLEYGLTRLKSLASSLRVPVFLTHLSPPRIKVKVPKFISRPPPLPVKMPAFLARERGTVPFLPPELIKKRLKFLGSIFILAFVVLAYRAFDLTVLQHNHLKGIAQRQYLKRVTVPAHRGRILDRNRRTLAISLPVKALSVDIDRVRDPDYLAGQLAPLLGLPLEPLRRRLKTAKKGQFPVLKRRLPPMVIRKIQQIEDPALFLIPETQRFYPMGETISHILGFTDFDGKGQEGIERSFEKDLKGKPGVSIFAHDRLGRPLPMAQTIAKAHPGDDIVLSIDANIQYIAYRTLMKGVAKAQAKGGVVVVMNPSRGEIYAMANQPGFNSNNLKKSKARERRNRVVADAYEPGSTFKVVTIASALDLGLVTPNTSFDVEGGKFRVANHTIRDFHRGKRWLTVTQILQTSSNVGAAKIGLKLGNENLNHYMDLFGFGRSTGTGLLNESPGSIPDVTHYRVVGLVSRSYGYGITATPLQITMASAAAVNGGILHKPHLVSGKMVGHQWVPKEYPEPAQVIKPETSAQIRAMLALAVGPEGTAPKARVEGYTVAGKTGTARKAMGKLGYVKGHYFASFVGFVPVDKPKLLIYVGVDEPKGVFYGGLVAAPIFRDIAREVLPLLSIFPERRTDPDLPGIHDPDPIKMIKRKVAKKEARKGAEKREQVVLDVEADVAGEAQEKSQEKTQEKTQEKSQEKTQEKSQEKSQEKTFDHLRQLSLMDALEQLKEENIIPRVEGFGRVVRVQKGRDGELHLLME